MVVIEANTGFLDAVRSSLSTVTGFVYSFARLPYRMTDSASQVFASRSELIADNERLSHEVLRLSTLAERYEALETENERLRVLLGSRAELPSDVMIAEIIGVSPDPNRHEITIDRGASDGVSVGQAVIDDRGLFGQTIETGEFTSRVLLVADASHALPVRVLRSNVRAVIAGTGALDVLLMENVPITSDIAEGDLLVSSGLGGRFPEGYPVGEVVRIERDAKQTFAVIEARPSAALDRSRHVLVVFETRRDGVDVEGISNE